ncbi:CoF synthetase [Formosa sp. S-31]|uniref:CoF synthetase n=1 Tax=Formosa sp. S-31 TaxID=2790949 RepID=UPI003EC0216B
MLTEVRKKSFWLLDTFKGRKVKAHFDNISMVIENFQNPESRLYRENKLNSILNHAISSTPFYQQFKNYNSLQDFPVINKNKVRDNFESFKSTSFIDKKNTAVFTSGSTGTPFKLLLNSDKINRRTADAIYFAKIAGYEIGSKLYYMKVWNDINKKSSLKLWQENIVPYSVYRYTDKDFEALIQELKDDKADKSLIGFASTFELLCNYLDKIKSPSLNECNVKSIIANSDALSTYTKNTMEKYFGIPTISRYSNIENGILAQQSLEGGENFDINWASFYIEILDLNNDIPAKYGELGRVVITDLHNYSMPLIRYDNGDIAVMDKNPKGENHAPVFTQISGRKADTIYNTCGHPITSYVVTPNMWKYRELKQFQFEQYGHKDYKFKLNPIKNFTKEKEIIEEFKGYLGEDANISLEYVNEIPLLSSGKRSLIINTYHTK